MSNKDTQLDINVLFADQFMIALSKPPGVPAVPDKSGDLSLLEAASKHFGQSLHPVHRIDRPVGGIFLCARDAGAMLALSAQFQTHAVKKTYLAVVESVPEPAEGVLRQFLVYRKAANKSIISDPGSPGAQAVALAYSVKGKSNRYCLLEIDLITGKKHQIRAQLSAIGCPIKGDVKYGARRGNPDRSIHLHGWKMDITHPYTLQVLHLEAPMPDTDAVWRAFLG